MDRSDEANCATGDGKRGEMLLSWEQPVANLFHHPDFPLEEAKVDSEAYRDACKRLEDFPLSEIMEQAEICAVSTPLLNKHSQGIMLKSSGNLTAPCVTVSNFCQVCHCSLLYVFRRANVSHIFCLAFLRFRQKRMS